MTIKLTTLTWASDLAADINAATACVTITALSMLPPRHHKPDAFGLLWSSLINAPARGVRVYVILPAPTPAHPACAQNNTTAATLAAHGITPIIRTSANLLHAKTVAIDERITWIGSGNFTAAAAHHNREAWLRTTDPAAALSLSAYHAYLTSAAFCRADTPA